MNTKDAELNFASFFIQNTFLIRFAVFEILSFFWKIFSKKRSISKTVYQIKNNSEYIRREIKFRVFFIQNTFLIRFAVFEILSFFWKIFSKKCFISKTAYQIKKSFEYKRREIKFRVFFNQKTFLIRFAVFEILSFFWKIFSKKRRNSETVNQIKKSF